MKTFEQFMKSEAVSIGENSDFLKAIDAKIKEVLGLKTTRDKARWNRQWGGKWDLDSSYRNPDFPIDRANPYVYVSGRFERFDGDDGDGTFTVPENGLKIVVGFNKPNRMDYNLKETPTVFPAQGPHDPQTGTSVGNLVVDFVIEEIEKNPDLIVLYPKAPADLQIKALESNYKNAKKITSPREETLEKFGHLWDMEDIGVI